MLPKVKSAEDISRPSKAGNSAIRVRTDRRLRALVPPVDLPVQLPIRPLIDTYLVPEAPQGA
eukprot:3840670-Prymnesium_polylepis.1